MDLENDLENCFFFRLILSVMDGTKKCRFFFGSTAQMTSEKSYKMSGLCIELIHFIQELDLLCVVKFIAMAQSGSSPGRGFE